MTYRTYDSIEVAYCLLAHAAEQGLKLTNLQLQKLSYVAHGLSLAKFDRPLVIEDIYAWQYGPVLPSIYYRFQPYGKGAITESHSVEIDGESDQLIAGVVSLLGKVTGYQLVEMTHKPDSPWTQIWDGKRNQVIPDSLIKQHYLRILLSGKATCL